MFSHWTDMLLLKCAACSSFLFSLVFGKTNFVFGKFFVFWKFLPSLQTELPLFLLCSFKYLNFLSCSLIYSSPALWLFLLMWNPRVVAADPRRVWDKIFLFRTGVCLTFFFFLFPCPFPSFPSLLPSSFHPFLFTARQSFFINSYFPSTDCVPRTSIASGEKTVIKSLPPVVFDL